MEGTDRQLEEARAYLHENAGVRQAVGAGAGDNLEPSHLGAGEHNLNYRFQVPGGGKFVLRVNVATQPFHDNQVAYEFAALRALEPSGCTPKPVYLDDSPAALGHGVLVESFCEGRELDFEHLQPGDLQRAARLMANVHAVPVPPDCPLHQPHDPLHELFRECIARFDVYRSSAFEDARITQWAERFIAAAERELDSSARRRAGGGVHIVNTEPLPSHFLIAGDAGAFIDWERPLVGEVAQDVAYFVAPTTTFWDSDHLMSSSEADRVVSLYWDAVGGRFAYDDFDERFRAYRVMTALRSITWCCRALVTYGQGGVHRTEKTMRKLPVYLSDDFLHYVAESCFTR